jgi:P-type Cu+ transporter
MAASTRALFSCFHGGGAEVSRHLALRPRYPSMPRRPRTAAVADDASGGGGSRGDLEAAKGAAEKEEEEEKLAVFAVTGMTCSACAGSVEKAVKRLPGIHDAAVDVLGGRAQVVFYPAFVSVSIGYLVDSLVTLYSFFFV